MKQIYETPVALVTVFVEPVKLNDVSVPGFETEDDEF